MPVAWERPAGAFEAFEGSQTAGSNALKKQMAGLKTDGWGMWLRELLPVALACRVGMPLLLWQATKEPSSTPPVVPGAGPASAKAGVGGYIYIYIYVLYHIYIYIVYIYIYCVYIYMYYCITLLH